MHVEEKKLPPPAILNPMQTALVDEDVAEVDETLADVVVVVVDVDVVDDEDVVLYVDVFEAGVSLIVRDDKGTVGPFLVSTFNDLFKI